MTRSFRAFERILLLTFLGQKGGVAKTCSSHHLASVWAQQGMSVCVVDADADRNRSATASSPEEFSRLRWFQPRLQRKPRAMPT